MVLQTQLSKLSKIKLKVVSETVTKVLMLFNSFLQTHSVNYVYHKMLLNENQSYLVLVARQILLVTINNVY